MRSQVRTLRYVNFEISQNLEINSEIRECQNFEIMSQTFEKISQKFEKSDI